MKWQHFKQQQQQEGAVGVQGGRRPLAGTGRAAGGGSANTNWTQTDSLYEITDILEVMKHIYLAPRFFRDTLFNITETCWGNEIQVDFRRGDSVALPFCDKYKRGIAKPRPRFITQYVEPGYIKSITNIKALDLQRRLPGEASYSSQSPEDRLAYWLADDLEEADLGISRREELLVSKILFEGKYQMIDGDDARLLGEIDFGPINRTVLDPLTYWDTANSDPLTDLRNIKQAVTRAGYSGGLIVFGQDAATSFLNNQAVLDKMNYFNYKVNEVDANQAEFGINNIGTFYGLKIIEYNAQYRDPFTNQMEFYCPPEQILVASTEIQNRLAYAEIVQTDPNDIKLVSSYRLSRVPQYIKVDEEDTVAFRLQSRPCPIPVDVLSWTVAQVCSRVSLPSDPIQPYTNPIGRAAYVMANANP